jgi:hypothetical protein
MVKQEKSVRMRIERMRSGEYTACRQLFGGCHGTGYLAGGLPHARCQRTGLVRVPKGKRPAKKKKRSMWL